MTTAASITAPIIAASGVSPILGAVACCVGSLFFGYFNDSYFWVVNRTLGVSEAKDQLTIWSVTSTVAWAVGVVEVLILNIFMRRFYTVIRAPVHYGFLCPDVRFGLTNADG